MSIFIRAARAAALAITLLSAQVAYAAIDSDAAIVQLKVDCDGADNCFEDSASLNSWISGTRQPSASAPLLVEIGPGRFGALACVTYGHTTYRGSGIDSTIIGALEYTGSPNGILMTNCDEATFESMTVQSTFAAVYSQGRGKTTWTNVDMVSNRFAWYDIGCIDFTTLEPVEQVHYFFSSRFRSLARGDAAVSDGTGMRVHCAENWIYGSDIVVSFEADPNMTAPTSYENYVGIEIKEDGEVRLFGSSVRAVPGELDPNTEVEIQGVELIGHPSKSGTFHMHGGIISLSGAGLNDADLTALDVGGTGVAHTPDTAYALIPAASGTNTRIKKASGAKASAPFQWPAGTTTPVPGLSTLDGSDTYLETDCDSTGDCDGAGSLIHQMVYNSAVCTTALWYDMTAGACRDGE